MSCRRVSHLASTAESRGLGVLVACIAALMLLRLVVVAIAGWMRLDVPGFAIAPLILLGLVVAEVAESRLLDEERI